MLLMSQEKPSESMFVSTWGVSRSESAENIASFFSLIGESTDMWVESGHKRSIAAVLYHRHFGMIGGTSKKSFVRFVRFLLVWWGYDWILEVVCEIFNVVDMRT